MTLASLLDNLFLFAFVLSWLGFGGGLIIGARGVPGRTKPAMWLWLAVPIVLVALIVLPYGDPALEGEAARRNAPFAVLLYGVVLSIPYAIASFIGLGLGRALRGRRRP
ncbi:MAG: hypothetical protein B7Z08_09250 [Sphingomonadales bacterium 32-68-7]|nr:MAG: hypothetical protein B7Z08_09250 [Sphingomonadales bacterium 32-68-7]